MTIQPRNINLNYVIDTAFTKVNRLFVLSFGRNAAGYRRDSFSHYYIPKNYYMLFSYKKANLHSDMYLRIIYVGITHWKPVIYFCPPKNLRFSSVLIGKKKNIGKARYAKWHRIMFIWLKIFYV